MCLINADNQWRVLRRQIPVKLSSSAELRWSEGPLKNPSCTRGSPVPQRAAETYRSWRQCWYGFGTPQMMFMTELYAVNAKESKHYVCVCLPVRPV